MNTHNREIYSTSANNWRPKAEHHLPRHHEFWKIARQGIEVIPFSIFSGIAFIGCSSIYVAHSQTLTNQMLVYFFIMSVVGCVLGALSLLTEKGGLHKIQAISCLIGNIILLSYFSISS